MLREHDIVILKRHWPAGEPSDELALRIRVATALPQRRPLWARLNALLPRPVAFASQGMALAACALFGIYLAQPTFDTPLDINSLAMADTGLTEGL